MNWISGVYVYREKNGTYMDMPTMMEIRNADLETFGYALFGQGEYKITEKLRVTAGLRYSYDDMEGDLDYSGIAGTYTFGDSFDGSVILPKLSLAYDITPDMMAYSTVSRGYLRRRIQYCICYFYKGFYIRPGIYHEL